MDQKYNGTDLKIEETDQQIRFLKFKSGNGSKI